MGGKNAWSLTTLTTMAAGSAFVLLPETHSCAHFWLPLGDRTYSSFVTIVTTGFLVSIGRAPKWQHFGKEPFQNGMGFGKQSFQNGWQFGKLGLEAGSRSGAWGLATTEAPDVLK